MVERKIHCLKCLAALTSSKEKVPDLFMVWKSNGGIKLPSLGLLKVCEETEKCVMRMLNVNHGTGLPEAIASTVLQVCVEHGVFSSLKQHMFDTTALHNHVFALIKCCLKCYVTIRMHHLGKQRNAKMHEKLIKVFITYVVQRTVSLRSWSYYCAFYMCSRFDRSVNDTAAHFTMCLGD